MLKTLHIENVAVIEKAESGFKRSVICVGTGQWFFGAQNAA